MSETAAPKPATKPDATDGLKTLPLAAAINAAEGHDASTPAPEVAAPAAGTKASTKATLSAEADPTAAGQSTPRGAGKRKGSAR